MVGKNSLLWIEKGFEIVAYNGFEALQVECIAKAIGKNKSSFYHYFGSIEVYISALLKYHEDYSVTFSESTKNAEKLNPDVINIFIADKTHVFFHKQLQIKRNIPEYKACYEKVYEMNKTALKDKFAVFFQIENKFTSTTLWSSFSRVFYLT